MTVAHKFEKENLHPTDNTNAVTRCFPTKIKSIWMVKIVHKKIFPHSLSEQVTVAHEPENSLRMESIV